MIRGELAEGVTGRRAHLASDSLACHGPNSGAMGQQCRLRVVGERQLIGWPVKTKLGE